MKSPWTGCPSSEAVGRQLTDVFHIVNAHTRQKVANPVEKVMAMGEIIGLANHTMLIARGGREYQIADSGAPIRQTDGHIVGVVLVFRDVTEAYAREQKIRENEKWLKNITANIPGVVCQLIATRDHVYACRYVSPKAAKIFGIEAPADAFFEAFIQCMPESDGKRFTASIREAVDHFGPWHYEGKFIKPSGESIWFSGSATPQRTGKDIVFNGVWMDITDRKHAENEAKRLETALLQARKMEAIGTLAGGIAHDFNNILSAVIGFSELSLPETAPETPVHGYIKQILTAGLRARDLVQQILTFSRKDARKLEPLQAVPLVKEALKLLRSSLPATIEICQHVDPGIDPVLADPTQIHQIIMNLCTSTNAAHAMETDGGRLDVGISQVRLSEWDILTHPGLIPGEYLKLSVQDAGRGIPPEIMAEYL